MQWRLPSLEAFYHYKRPALHSILDTPKISSDLGASVRTLQDFFVVCQCARQYISNKVMINCEVFLEA